MSNVQVSNARRVVFTAMAVGALWIMSIAAHSLAFSGTLFLKQYLWFGAQGANAIMGSSLWSYRALALGLLFALLPLCLLSLASHNSPIKLRDDHVLVGGALFATCIGLCFHAGEGDLRNALANRSLDYSLPSLWLLLPIVFTTAFVIGRAWRRVRCGMPEPQRALRCYGDY